MRWCVLGEAAEPGLAAALRDGFRAAGHEIAGDPAGADATIALSPAAAAGTTGAVVWVGDAAALAGLGAMAADAALVLVNGDEALLERIEREHGVRACTLPVWAAPSPEPAGDRSVEIAAVDEPAAEHEPARDLAASLPFSSILSAHAGDFAKASAAVALAPRTDAGGSFLPWWLARAAAAGTPAVMHAETPLPGIGSAIAVGSRADAVAIVRAWLADPGELAEARRRARAEFDAALSATAAATAVAALLADPPAGGAAERARAWRAAHPAAGPVERPTAAPPPGPLPPPIEEQTAALAADPGRSPAGRYRIVHIGSYVVGETDVVRRMLEALRTLGHDVVAVDPRRHPVLGDARRITGVDPIELDADALLPLVERFRPDIVLFNAGGFHPSAEAAGRLRERGVLLLHAVLSDPDARECTLGYADRFDAVVTNAASCVQAYRDAGVGFVEHMPFAVDRAFVLMPVPRKPGWSAEVICVGNGRPDRQATIDALDERFDVRVYGRKWRQDAEVVRGGDVLVALREGRFHVNFPRTLAGFTNVKVGVFESVAQGGVLCTEVFDEMAELFDYEREIVGYRSAEQLAAAIGHLSRHPEEAEEIRRRGFARLLAEHLYEQRFAALFAGLREAGVLGDGRAGRGRSVVAAGFYGMRNAGDDLILRTIHDEIVRRDPEARVRAIGFNRTRLLVEEGFDGADVGELHDAEDAIRSADVLLLGGGGLIHDATFRLSGGIPDLFDNARSGLAMLGKLVLMAHIHGVPVVWLALGAGPLDTPDGRTLARFLAERAAAVTVRDADSADVLRAAGVLGVEEAADPTLLITRPDDAAVRAALRPLGLPAGGYLFASLRRFAGAHPGLERRLAEALDEASGRTGLPVVFVPFQRTTASGDDAAYHAEIAAMMTEPTAALDVTATVEEICAVIAGARAGLSMRLHGSILANSFGVATAGLAYDPKVRAHYRTLGVEERCLGLSAEPEAIAAAVASCATEGAAEVFAAALEAARERASRPFDAAMEAAGRRDRGPDLPPQPYPRRHSERDFKLGVYERSSLRARREAAGLRREIEGYRKAIERLEAELERERRRVERIQENPMIRAGVAFKRRLRGKDDPRP